MSSCSEDHLATLNHFGAITASALHAVYPCTPEANLTQPRAVTAKKRVTHCIHADAMHREWKYIELGISKGSCEKFIHDVLGEIPGELLPPEVAAGLDVCASCGPA